MPIVKSTSMVEGEAIDIYIEVDDLPQEKSPYGNTRGDGKDIPKAAVDMFESGLDLARQCAKQAVTGIQKMDEKFRPEEFEVANQPFSAWDAIFTDSMMTVAAIDRLIHHAVVLEMHGESFRQHQAKKRLLPAAKTKSASKEIAETAP